MSEIKKLQSWTKSFLTASSTRDRALKASLEADAEGISGPAIKFSPFIPSHARRAYELSKRFTELADSVGGEAGLRAVSEEAERTASTEDPELVRYALRVFITHHPEAKRLPIPPIEKRAPDKVVAAKLPEDLEALASDEAVGGADQESQLDWYREDADANDHHAHWHDVYPSGAPKNELKDRHGELFFYMHQQMIARYKTERLALGMDPLKPLDDFRKKIPEGYDPKIPGYSPRKPGSKLVDTNFKDGSSNYTVSTLERDRDRMLTAARHGYFKKRGGDKVKINANSLGNTEESNDGSINADFYGQHHNSGHNLISWIHDPTGQTDPGIMYDSLVSICDPIFYRWHGHVDDVSFTWQETQPPNDLSDAPKVLIRKNIKGSTSKNQSPDIILCFKDRVPGAAKAKFNGQTYGKKTFGDENWDKDFQTGGVVTDELHTMMRSRKHRFTGEKKDRIINYLTHRDFFYFLRVENLLDKPQKVTVRIFLAAKKVENDRRMYLEMDKFEYTLKASERAVIFRPAELSSVIRKPAVRYSKDGKRLSGKHKAGDGSYCQCGWPYNLLLPRGTREGMSFRLVVMFTDWEKDQVGHDTKCGSMSFCGAKDRYPDRRGMGYPFDRPFKGDSINQTIASQDNMAAGDLIIKWVDE